MDGGIFRLIHWAVKERFRSDKRGPGERLGRGGNVPARVGGGTE